MILRDAKIGQRIKVWIRSDLSANTSYVTIDSFHSTGSISALVLEQDHISNTTVLGWKEDETKPSFMSIAAPSLTDAWKVQGIVMAHEYTNTVQCEPDDEPIPPTKKNYGNECPCGIHPSKCDYHRS